MTTCCWSGVLVNHLRPKITEGRDQTETGNHVPLLALSTERMSILPVKQVSARDRDIDRWALIVVARSVETYVSHPRASRIRTVQNRQMISQETSSLILQREGLVYSPRAHGPSHREQVPISLRHNDPYPFKWDVSLVALGPTALHHHLTHRKPKRRNSFRPTSPPEPRYSGCGGRQ